MYDKYEIKSQLTLEEIESILEDLGAHFYREGDEKLVIETICHNDIGEGSHKLYYYTNTQLFNCYTSCGAFDIFQLVMNVAETRGEDWELDEAVRWVGDRKGFILFGADSEELSQRYKPDENKEYVKPELKSYSRKNFDRLPPALVKDWVEEGISEYAHQRFEVRYNPVDGAIVFPHYDEKGNLVGIRQRNMVEEFIERYGKYRPATIRGKLYSSPLSFYLFGLNVNRYPINRTKKAILFEGEKLALVYLTK